MKHKFEIFLDTDILTGNKNVVNKCTEIFSACYTSVINASEVFSRAKDNEEADKMKDLFSKVHILGIPFRYSVTVGEVLRYTKKKSPETLFGTRLL